MTRDYSAPQARQIAYFAKLHLDEAVVNDETPKKDSDVVYSVPAKFRPALVIRCLARERGCLWFRIACITKEGKDGQGNLRHGHAPLGQLLEDGVENFLDLNVLKIPQTLLARAPREYRAHELPPDVYISVVKQIANHTLTALQGDVHV